MPYSKVEKRAYNKAYYAGKRAAERAASAYLGEQMRMLQSRVTLLEADRVLLEAMVRQAEEWSS